MRDFKAKLIELIDKHNLSHLKEQILSVSEESIFVRKTKKEDYEKIGSSRFCGYPDLPLEIKWPILTELKEEFFKDHIGLPKLFSIQINLSELPDIGKLPKEGMLYFFIGDSLYGEEGSEIIYYPNKLSEIQDLKGKIDATSCACGEPDEKYHLNNGYKIEFEQALTIPNSYSDIFESLKFIQEDENKYYDLFNEFYEFSIEGYDGRDLINMMFGHVFCGGENLRKMISDYKEIGSEKDWNVIFSLQSDNDLGFCFNDYGSFSYLIFKKDLKELNFKKIETTMWSS